MTKIKVEKRKNYTVMSNHHLQNKKLSLKAKGLMSFMLSLPDDWDYTEMGLVKVLKEGREAIRSGLRELENHHYLIRIKREREAGKFGGYDYELHETTVYGKPSTVEPMSEKPMSENHTQIITKEQITNKTITNINNKPYSPLEASDLFWEMYPKKINRDKCKEKYIRLINKEPELGQIIYDDLQAKVESDQWTKQNGQFIPLPMTYLNQRRWEDEISYGASKEIDTGVTYT